MSWKILRAMLTLCACALALPGTRLEAFSLLGPYEAWMQTSNCFRLLLTPLYDKPGDVGGPMCISNGYRWNVPVVTYGFDRSFINFFGTNGVAAVEGAIQIINDLPPASSVVLTNYSGDSQLINYEAQAESLYDLQSVTLSLLLEQLGLASPTRFAYVLRSWSNGPDGPESISVTMRNYDPETLLPTAWVNRDSYVYEIWSGWAINLDEAEALTYAQGTIDPLYTAVADNRLDVGGFYAGLTADDVGGLCYLFSTSNVNYETLLPGVSRIDTNADLLVNGALRPGIDKITFLQHSSGTNPWDFLPMTNLYTDTYITNGSVMQQQVQRVVNQPDFLFCAGDAGTEYPALFPFARSGTSNWINNAPLNGNPAGAGPGVIQPPVRITLDKLGQILGTFGSGLQENNYDASIFWGTYDGSTNPPVIYPLPQSGTNQLALRLWFLYAPQLPTTQWRSIELSATGQIGASFLLQSSTNLTDWISLATNQINGSIFTLIEEPSVAGRFYRLVPQ
jgi:hypothetical protein